MSEETETLTAMGIMALAFIFALGMMFIEHVGLRLFAPPPSLNAGDTAARIERLANQTYYTVTDNKGHKISINADSKTWGCDNGEKDCWFMTKEESK